MSEAARAALQAKREKKKVNGSIHKKNLFDFKYYDAKKLNEELQQQIEKLQKELETMTQKSTENKNEILNDLMKHSLEKNAPFSSETVSLAMEIKSISPKAYKLLVQELNFPSEYIVDKTMKEIIADIPETLTNIEKSTQLIDLFFDTNNINKTEKIDVCLAVDALYFDPELKVNEKGEISGMFSKTKLSRKILNIFTKSPKNLENFLTLNSKNIVHAGFVFQVQPFDIALKPFVIHIFPSTNGKSNEDVIELLHKLRKILKNRNFNVRSYAFDGDNAYSQLHKTYYESYIH